MSRGYWVHRRVYKEGCCGGPSCCVIALLAIPVWPLLCGFAVIKENVISKKEPAVISEVNQDHTSSETVVLDADDR